MIKYNKKYLPNEPLTFLVSGGIDSISAAHWLKVKCRKQFYILHCNHKVQPLNEEMENSVKKFCIEFDIRYDSYFRIDAEFPDISENGLREFRLCIMKMTCGNFITAHHLTDACESYLMNCFHGTPEYLPIPWMSEFDNFSIYHPFLQTSKDDFINYANENDLMKYVVEDPTNKDTGPKRNWVRNVIIPEINVRNMGIETIVRKKFYK